jgi:hypothetical protein
MNEPILDFVLRRLDDCKGQIKVIANETRIPYSTLSKIAQRVTPNPGVNHIQTLADYFKRQA